MINTDSVLHGFTDLKNLDSLGPIVLNQAKGIYVYDQDGKNILMLILVYGIRSWF
ncbi:MAG: hypothetical protein CM15mP70_13270 [Pelagibacteraceae bacterium]|nr:MAG: hypothetical protein CM15mP70_13270 [Pelagibacteraceae bacterium]